MIDYSEIDEVRETKDVHIVNKLIKEGWVLIEKSAGSMIDSSGDSSAYILYSLAHLYDESASLKEWA